jgi:hypothetical protein
MSPDHSHATEALEKGLTDTLPIIGRSRAIADGQGEGKTMAGQLSLVD